jgi:hypothetical protein
MQTQYNSQTQRTQEQEEGYQAIRRAIWALQRADITLKQNAEYASAIQDLCGLSARWLAENKLGRGAR